MKIVHHVAGMAALLLVAGTTLRAQAVPGRTGPASSAMPAVLQNVGFEPPLAGQMPLDLPFRDETGRSVRLRDYFGQQKPVVLSLVYNECPMLNDHSEQSVIAMPHTLSF